jgi:hypothetical protein
MRRPSLLALSALIVLATASTASADRVRLRAGKTVNGLLMGADPKSVRLLLDNGSVAEFPVEDVAAVEFTPRKAAAPPAEAPDPAKQPAPITIPTGTVLNVLLSEAIEVDAAKTGQTYKAQLDDPVMIGGKVVLPRGAPFVLQAAKVDRRRGGRRGGYRRREPGHREPQVADRDAPPIYAERGRLDQAVSADYDEDARRA